MRRLSKFIKSNTRLMVGIVIGATVSGSAVYAATILFNADQVGFDNTGSSLSSTNVQGALDELYTKANTWIDPSTIKTNLSGKIFASSKGIVIRRDGGTHFIKVNNWDNEKTHIKKQVFSDIICIENSSSLLCDADDFGCDADYHGNVHCYDRQSNYLGCIVDSNGSVSCD